MALNAGQLARCRRLNFGSYRCETCRDKFICFTGEGGTKVTPTHLFELPNDEAAWAFIDMVKKYLNKDVWRIKVRGRHSNRKIALGKTWSQYGGNDVPLKKAEWLAVYLFYAEDHHLTDTDGTDII